MKTIKKWIKNLNKYENVAISEAWDITAFETDMEHKYNCASCGKLIKFGDGYTSLFLHTDNGFGYIVCSDCHFNIELPEEYKR